MINLFHFSFRSAFRFPCPQHSSSTVLLIMTVARMHTPSQQESHTDTFSVLYCSVCPTCASDFAPAHKPMNCGKTHSYTHACKDRCLRVFSTRLLHTRVCGTRLPLWTTWACYVIHSKSHAWCFLGKHVTSSFRIQCLLVFLAATAGTQHVTSLIAPSPHSRAHNQGYCSDKKKWSSPSRH